MDLEELEFALSTLTVYKTDDELIIKLTELLTAIVNENDFAPAARSYCEFCSMLYASGCDIGEYIGRAVLYADNVYSRACSSGEKLPPYCELAAKKDVLALSSAASLNSDLLKGYLATKYPAFKNRIGALPDFKPQALTDLTSASAGKFYRANGFGVFARYRAFSFEKCGTGYALNPVEAPDPIRLCELKQYEFQRNKVVENTLAFLKGKPYNNVLLYGDRGTGKSSTVKAILNEYYKQGLRLVQIDKQNLYGLSQLSEKLSKVPLKFILFVDDLTFNENEDSFGMLKGVLEGGIVKRPDNIAIYATSNRRHLIKESFTAREGDEIHKADTIDENLSLSDRFGLMITFTAPAKDKYLELVRLIADDRKLTIDNDALFSGAERFAMRKGGRSPRIARQYVDDLEAGLPV